MAQKTTKTNTITTKEESWWWKIPEAKGEGTTKITTGIMSVQTAPIPQATRIPQYTAGTRTDVASLQRYAAARNVVAKQVGSPRRWETSAIYGTGSLLGPTASLGSVYF